MNTDRIVSQIAQHPALINQPHALLHLENSSVLILGTAHVSQSSVDAVKSLIASGHFTRVAVELDKNRHQSLTNPDALLKTDLVQIIREGKAGLMAPNLVMASYQRRLAEQLGVEPGAELKAAALDSAQQKLPLDLSDRDIATTFRRVWLRLGWWKRSMLASGIMGNLFVSEKVADDEIEKLKQGDMLESSFSEFAGSHPGLYAALIDERDQYMAAHLRKISQQESGPVLAVVGAGHLAGIQKYIVNEKRDPDAVLAELNSIPETSDIPWFTIVLASFLVGGFAWGFAQGGLSVGTQMILSWILITGAGGAIGCLAAGGHPLSILAAFISSPVTPLHPALGSGMVSALVEARMRRPQYAEFLALRDDVTTIKGWWRNRVSRTLLNFFLTSLGTAIAVWIAGIQLVTQLD